jgi:CheY-like chemotaxis protein
LPSPLLRAYTLLIPRYILAYKENYPVNQPAGNIESPNIWIVDDDPVVTSALSRLLHKEGYRTAIFANAHDTLAYTRRHADADAAIVDIHLPDLSGLVLSARLRQHLGPATPIIILSGDTSIENLRSLPHAGATFFLPKPLKTDYLITRLKELGLTTM